MRHCDHCGSYGVYRHPVSVTTKVQGHRAGCGLESIHMRPCGTFLHVIWWPCVIYIVAITSGGPTDRTRT